jgi:hypothetical protein
MLGDKDVLDIVGVGGGCGFGGGRTAARRSPRRGTEGTTERVEIGGKEPYRSGAASSRFTAAMKNDGLPRRDPYFGDFAGGESE